MSGWVDVVSASQREYGYRINLGMTTHAKVVGGARRYAVQFTVNQHTYVTTREWKTEEAVQAWLDRACPVFD
ncbi:hypothetical protein [Actinoallomurus rhizosphaericola]|uniref:hypothetical protein n=1 Tax=Actinoallomurus rhizosphaericola TaxID=2952536 RepID=UPI002092F867|nr:hypothetical protein [Actinoallomurus rhizosphaericola]MCO6000139.1 hypothetical protein [Actinoallomurus rhizosphaericola]